MIDMAGYYDLVLGLIPLAFGSLAGALSLAGFATTQSVVAGALVAVVLVVHAMFVRAPVDSAPEPVAAAPASTPGPETGAN